MPDKVGMEMMRRGTNPSRPRGMGERPDHRTKGVGRGLCPWRVQAACAARNSVLFFISAWAVRTMRFARAIAACLGFLRWMIFHSQSSPASPRRRALTWVVPHRVL